MQTAIPSARDGSAASANAGPDGTGSHRLDPTGSTSMHIVKLGFVVLAAVGCATDEVAESVTESALTTRIKDGYIEINAARGGNASSSGAYATQPVWTVNDGRRGSPWEPSISQYAYWASSTTGFKFPCNWGDWWVRVSFAPPPGTVCPWTPGSPPGSCVRTISEIDLFSLQDDYWNGTDPTPSTVTTQYGSREFYLQYCPEGRTCTATSGWVTPPGGYITGNNKAWTSASFAPVRATAVRASIDCSQSPRAYAVELEAWERQAPPACTFATIPQDNVLPYVGDDSSTASIIADTDRFWWLWFGYATDAVTINNWLRSDSAQGQWWDFGARATALVKMYDLLAPIDFPRAKVYLDRLREMANAFLANRDDKRDGPPRFDPWRGQVMPAWGGVDVAFDTTWTTQIDMAGLFTYPMAAFARRVAEHPDLFCLDYRLDAIKFTTAVMETYVAFRQDMRFSDPANPSWGYYIYPPSWSGLHCNIFDTKLRETCEKNRLAANKPVSWNQGLSFLRALGEVARAADSELYRSSSDSVNNAFYVYYATQEAPRLIAKDVKAFLDHMEGETLGDGTPWYWWRYGKDIGPWPEDLSHGGFTLGGLVSIWENRGVIDGLLARYGYPERIPLNPTYFNGIANGFLRRIWYYDYTPGSSLRNLLTDRVDGPLSGLYPNSDAPIPSLTENGNPYCTGWAGLSSFNPWVWVRCRDATYNPFILPPSDCVGLYCIWPAINVENHAALLRYRL